MSGRPGEGPREYDIDPSYRLSEDDAEEYRIRQPSLHPTSGFSAPSTLSLAEVCTATPQASLFAREHLHQQR